MNKTSKKWGYLSILALVVSITLAIACKKESGEETEEETGFNRKEMLRNYADNLIIPSFSDLNQKTKALQSAVNDFAANTDAANLQKVQEAWKSAYISWQSANAFNLGPAGEEGLKKGMSEEIATFPVNVSIIQTRIANNNTSFNDFQRDTRGLLAIDYLAFGTAGDNSAIVSYYAGNTNAVNYLKAVTNHTAQYVEGVLNAWNGGYKETFINNTGTSVGSSTSLLYNEFVKSFETIKNYKIGLPIGKAPGVEVPKNPALVEAYYSGISIQLLKEHLKVIEQFWRGTSKNGQDGIGFKAYLESVEGGKALVASTEEQLAKVKAAMNALDDNKRLSDMVASGGADLDALENIYLELAKHTRFFKSDMSSLLGITITYSSGDGD